MCLRYKIFVHETNLRQRMSSRFKNPSSFRIDNDNAFYFESWHTAVVVLSLAKIAVPLQMHFTLARIRALQNVTQHKNENEINALIYAFDVTMIIVLIELILK